MNILLHQLSSTVLVRLLLYCLQSVSAMEHGTHWNICTNSSREDSYSIATVLGYSTSTVLY